MTKKVDTWMPFLVDKYLGDTTHLNTEQHGAYFLMLLSMWKKDGVLPLDDGQLASITRLAPGKWRAHKPVLMAFFTASPDGAGFTQKRLLAELARAKATSAAKAEAGAKGAGKRWHSDGTAIGEGIAQPIADGSQSASQTDAPIPIPIPIEQKQEREPRAPTPAGEACLAMRKAGLTSVNPSDPRLMAMLTAGMTPDELGAAAGDAVAAGKGFAYAMATAEGRRRDAAKVGALPAANGADLQTLFRRGGA